MDTAKRSVTKDGIDFRIFHLKEGGSIVSVTNGEYWRQYESPVVIGNFDDPILLKKLDIFREEVARLDSKVL